MAQTPGDRRRPTPATTGGMQPPQGRPGGAAPPRPAAFWSNATPLSPFDSRLDNLRQTPAQPRTTITRGGRTYKEIDNGIANVLVPTLDPGTSQAKVAANRAAIERAFYMANNPLAGTAYGFATLAGASPRTRDIAMQVGGAADLIVGSSAPRISPIRRPTPAKQGQVADPSWQRPNIRPSELNADRQAGRVEATSTADMLGTGTKAYWRIRPPGFEGEDAGHGRGHLYPKALGGKGNDPRLLVTLTQNPTNNSHMPRFDREVIKQVKAGEVIEYSATPFYYPGVGPPGTILMTATGSRGTRMAKIVQNPAGRRK